MGFTITSKRHINPATGSELTLPRVGTQAEYRNGQYVATYAANLVYTVRTDDLGVSKVTISGLRRLQQNLSRLKIRVTAQDGTKFEGTVPTTGSVILTVKLPPNKVCNVTLYCEGFCDFFDDANAELSGTGAYGNAATVEADDGTFGGTIPIQIVNGHPDALYTIMASCAGRTETLMAKGSATSMGWTPDLVTYAQLITNTGSVPATITCETFYDDVSAGTQQTRITVSFATGSLPPVLTSGWASHAPYNTGSAAENIAAYVQGYSKAQISFDATKISYQYGAHLAKYKISCEGTEDSSSPYLTDVLRGTTATVTCTVVDTRGQEASETLTITLNPYSNPRLQEIVIYRSDANGNESEDGACFAARARAIISPIEGLNTYVMQAQVKTIQGSYGAATPMFSSQVAILTGYSPDTPYDIKITLTDLLGNESTFTQRFPGRQWALKFRPDGNGAAFGKAADLDATLELAGGWVLALRDTNGNVATLNYAQLQALLALI